MIKIIRQKLKNSLTFLEKIKESIMCQSTLFLKKEDKEEEIMRDVIWVEPYEDKVKVQALFEAPKELKARICYIDLLKHRIVLEPI